MSASSNDSPDLPGVLRDAPLDLAFELPVQPGYRELPPKGSWEDGYRLSLLALASLNDDSPVWEQRRIRRVDVEFVL